MKRFIKENINSETCLILGGVTITTWEELTRTFLAKFFLPSKIASLRIQITTLAQRKDETLDED